ncbi:hypothetical protein BC939DRAFT_302050 [Gamsiella multidivaricata]|uniref:uncharacterized protein n=1 Tax=Gamsiella multidivaricata TaxID=101098 RepID=UPI0022209F0C|nr:uncharacterized protein BC939DRAFT_302050 [Gamsiella multidivaricata]KAI7830199.1 hypothetical protein BC939DRAFT_302050 [Gamsiella multidivaricata]
MEAVTAVWRRLSISGTNFDFLRVRFRLAETVPTSRMIVGCSQPIAQTKSPFPVESVTGFGVFSFSFFFTTSLRASAPGPKGFSGTFVHAFHMYCFITSGGSCCLSPVRCLIEYLGWYRGVLVRGKAGCASIGLSASYIKGRSIVRYRLKFWQVLCCWTFTPLDSLLQVHKDYNKIE